MLVPKLFVSHSSRLDDVEHKYTSQDHNWRLLEDTCGAIRRYYGASVRVLVDQDGLVPGADWNRQLDLWMAECHVALILFSKRAVEKSDCVLAVDVALATDRPLRVCGNPGCGKSRQRRRERPGTGDFRAGAPAP